MHETQSKTILTKVWVKLFGVYSMHDVMAQGWKT